MRTPFACCLVLCVCFVWAESCPAQEAEKGKSEPASAPYKIELVKIGNTYQGLKYRPATGEAWQIVVDKWEKISEMANCPAGEYQITLIPDENGFQAIRMEILTGTTCLLRNRKWNPIKEPDIEKPAPVPKAARDGQAYELRHVRVGNQLHVLRLHTGTGAVAHIAGDAYETYPEPAGPVPAGKYEVTMMATKDA